MVVLPYVRGVAEGVPQGTEGGEDSDILQTPQQPSLDTGSPEEPSPTRGGGVQDPFGSCDMTYVGLTGHTLGQRRKEHRRALVSVDVHLSALAEHALQHSYVIAWGEATVLDANRFLHQRSTLEAWHIQ